MSKKKNPQIQEFRPTSKGLPEDSAFGSPIVRQSGHYVDAKLRVEASASKLNNVTTSGTWKNLTDIEPALEKLIFALTSLLEQQTNGFSDVSGPLTTWGQTKLPQAQLACKPSELYREHTGKQDYSGKDIENINKLIDELMRTPFRCVYVSKYHDGKTERVNRIDVTAPIITEYNEFRTDLTTEQNEKLDQDDPETRRRRPADLLRFIFSPMMTHDIGQKWVEYPRDFFHKLDSAIGHGNKKTKAMTRLAAYLLREISNKRTNCEINNDKLIGTLGLQKDWRQGRKKRVEERITEAISAMKLVGLIEDHKTVPGKQGQEKHVFRLNPGFTRPTKNKPPHLPLGEAT